MTDDEERGVLQQRATALARVRSEALPEQQAYALFERAGARHVIEKRFIVEVARVPPPTPIPLSPAHWLGVSSLHGELLAVADLTPLLEEGARASASGASADALDEPLLVLVLGLERREFALAIDMLLDLGSASVVLSRHAGGPSASPLVLGALSDGAAVLDGSALLCDPRLTIQAPLSTHP
jgi:chemotaxis signal transduction protein